MPFKVIRRVGRDQKYFAMYEGRYYGYDPIKKRPIIKWRYICMVPNPVTLQNPTKEKFNTLLKRAKSLQRELTNVRKAINYYYETLKEKGEITKQNEERMKELEEGSS